MSYGNVMDQKALFKDDDMGFVYTVKVVNVRIRWFTFSNKILFFFGQADRKLIYYTYDDRDLAHSLEDFVNYARGQKYTVGDLMKFLEIYEEKKSEMENYLNKRLASGDQDKILKEYDLDAGVDVLFFVRNYNYCQATGECDLKKEKN